MKHTQTKNMPHILCVYFLWHFTSSKLNSIPNLRSQREDRTEETTCQWKLQLFTMMIHPTCFLICRVLKLGGGGGGGGGKALTMTMTPWNLGGCICNPKKTERYRKFQIWDWFFSVFFRFFSVFLVFFGFFQFFHFCQF